MAPQFDARGHARSIRSSPPPFALNSKHSQGSASSSHSIDLGLKLLDRLGCTLRGPLNYQGPLVALLHGVNKDDLMSGTLAAFGACT